MVLNLFITQKNNDSITFASEIKSLLKNPSITKKVNNQAIYDFISLHYVPGSETAFRNIFEVPPGTVMIWQNGKSKIREYNSFKNIFYNDNFNKNVIYDLPKVFDNAISSQMISDVPISVLLSGGIDSSLVAEVISRFSDEKGIPSHTIKFNDKDYDESSFAKKVAESLGYNHKIKELTSDDLNIETIENTLTHFDEPFADSSLFPMYLVSKEISKNNKVAFSGDGGDEVFGGYDRFIQVPMIYRTKKIPQFMRTLINLILSPMSHKSDIARKLVKGLKLSRMKIHELLFSFSAYLSEEQKMSYIMIKIMDY